jgi:hypothetical protein
MRTVLIIAVVMLLGTAGPSLAGERAITGAAIGGGIGAVVAGPPGAVIGGAVGALVGGPRLTRSRVVCWRDSRGVRRCRRR